MAGPTPVPFEGVFVLFYFSGNGYSSVRIVHLTGKHFGIISMYICSFLFWLFYFILKKINNLLILFNHSHDNLSIDEIFAIVFC